MYMSPIAVIDRVGIEEIDGQMKAFEIKSAAEVEICQAMRNSSGSRSDTL